MTTKEFEVQIALGTLSTEDKRGLAFNSITLREILSILSTDKDSIVREYVAHNLNTPIGMLEKLSTDENSNVRWEVAHNPNTPKDIVGAL